MLPPRSGCRWARCCPGSAGAGPDWPACWPRPPTTEEGPTLRCDELATVQTALVEGCLDDDVRLHAEAHVALCGPCAARVERERAVKEAVAGAVEPVTAGLRQAVAREAGGHGSLADRADGASGRRFG